MRAIVSALTEQELRCYVEWAGRLTLISSDEVLVRGVDQAALGDYFKRDKRWRPLRAEILAKAAARRWNTIAAAVKASRDGDADPLR